MAKSKYEAAHEADIDIIGQRMAQLAQREGWCKTFFDEVEALNKELSKPITVARSTEEGEIEITFIACRDIVIPTKSELDKFADWVGLELVSRFRMGSYDEHQIIFRDHMSGQVVCA